MSFAGADSLASSGLSKLRGAGLTLGGATGAGIGTALLRPVSGYVGGAMGAAMGKALQAAREAGIQTADYLVSQALPDANAGLADQGDAAEPSVADDGAWQPSAVPVSRLSSGVTFAVVLHRLRCARCGSRADHVLLDNQVLDWRRRVIRLWGRGSHS